MNLDIFLMHEDAELNERRQVNAKRFRNYSRLVNWAYHKKQAGFTVKMVVTDRDFLHNLPDFDYRTSIKDQSPLHVMAYDFLTAKNKADKKLIIQWYKDGHQPASLKEIQAVQEGNTTLN